MCLHAGPDFGEGIPLHRQARARSGNFANEQAGERSDDGDRQQHPAHDQRLAFPAREQERSDAGSEHDGGEGGKFQQSVGARQLRFAQHLGQDAVFGGAEEIGLHGQQEQHHQQHFDAAQRKRDDPDAHDHDFESLGDLQDAGLAETVGELAGVTGEQQERQNEDRARHRQIARTEQLIRGQLHGAHRNDHLINVVVERGQELRPEERLKAAVAQERRIPGGFAS